MVDWCSGCFATWIADALSTRIGEGCYISYPNPPSKYLIHITSYPTLETVVYSDSYSVLDSDT